MLARQSPLKKCLRLLLGRVCGSQTRRNLRARGPGEVLVGGGSAQLEINKSMLIQHKAVITSGPLWLKHSLVCCYRAGGALLLSMFMKC